VTFVTATVYSEQLCRVVGFDPGEDQVVLVCGSRVDVGSLRSVNIGLASYRRPVGSRYWWSQTSNRAVAMNANALRSVLARRFS